MKPSIDIVDSIKASSMTKIDESFGLQREY